MGLYWTGTGFEERMNLMPPSPAGSATPQSQQTTAFQNACDFPERNKNGLPGTQVRVLQKLSQEMGKRFLLQADPKRGESRKQNDDSNLEAGMVSYDPDLGSWVRAREIPASTRIPDGTADSGSSAAVTAFEQPQKKSARERGSRFNRTSWFRIESEQRRVLVTPPPEKSSENQLRSVAVSEEASAAAAPLAAQDVLAPEVQIAANEGVAFVTDSSIADTQEMVNHEAETLEGERTAVPGASLTADQVSTIPVPMSAVADEAAIVPGSVPAMSQDTTAPEAIVAAECQLAPRPVTASVPDGKPDGYIWQSAIEQGEGIASSVRSAADILVIPDPDKSRWFVLNDVLGRTAEQRAPAPESENVVPVLQVFSLAGGAGKTTLVATLGRALSARGERVLLVEATPSGSLQYFFGARDCRPGVLRTFRPPDPKSDAPIRLVSIAPESLLLEAVSQGSLAMDIRRSAQGTSRAIVDVGTGSATAVRALSRLSPVVLVPLVPDMSSVATANTMDLFFQRYAGASADRPAIFYVLNQFDSSLPLHLDLRDALRERLGEQLLPFALERTTEISDAMAEGMTAMDYAPDWKASSGFTSLANWLQDVQKAAATSRHGRWSER